MKGLRSGVMAGYAIGDYFNGDESGLEKYDAILRQEFENYLVTRAGFYRQERRWENAIFWRRRFDYITLHPGQFLRSTAKASRPVQYLATSLSAAELKLLCRLCITPRRAQEIVSTFSAEQGAVSSRRVILALQDLLRAGLIQPTIA